MTDHDEPGQLDTEAYVAEVNQLRELIDSERQLRRSAEKAADKQARAVRILGRELSAERNARMDTSRLHKCEDQLDLRSAELSESRRGTVVMIIGAVILGALCAFLAWWGVSMSDGDGAVLPIFFGVIIGVVSLGLSAGAAGKWADIPKCRHKVRLAKREYDRALTRHAEEILRGDA